VEDARRVPEPPIDREDALVIMGALADIVSELRGIRELLEDTLGGEEEEDPEGED
jgi:hypothetical protein